MLKRLVLVAMILASAPVAAEDLSGTAPAPSGVSDFTLERIVRAAYTGAAAFARDNRNYFARDGAYGPLREAVAAELEGEGIAGVVVADELAESFEMASLCLDAPGAELRLLSNLYGDGLDLVAVSATRMFAYRYDPHEDASIRLVDARDCRPAK
jgi:hypothetical protein